MIVRDEANRILLGKRNKDPQRGSWILPGGKIRAFESVADAAARELYEETGLEIEVYKQFQVYEIIDPPNEHRIVIYSWARVRGGVLKAADDVSEVKFVSFEELGALPLTPLVRRVLRDAGYMNTVTQPVQPVVVPRNETLFPMLIAGAARQHWHRRARRKAFSRPTPRSSTYTQASLSFVSGLHD